MSDMPPLPNPDPSLATKEGIEKAVASERDWVAAQLDVIRERLTGIDEATRLRLVGVDHIPAEIDEKVRCLADLIESKLASVDQRFVLQEQQRIEQKRDTKDAVDAALSAAKEAVKEQTIAAQTSTTKSELTTNETINKLTQLSDTTNKALADKIDDLKDRVNRIESVKVGVVENQTTRQQSSAMVALIVGLVLTFGGLLAAVIALVLKP